MVFLITGTMEIQYDTKNYGTRYWRDGSVIRNTDCSFQGPKFNCQHPYGGSQLSINLLPRDLTLLLACVGTRHVCDAETYAHVQI